MSTLSTTFADYLAAQAADTGAGAAVCVWQNGQEMLHLCGGGDGRGGAWSPDTLVPVYSATKAASAACLLLALYDCCQTPDLEVGALWANFPLPHATIGQLLSHQCGLAALDTPAPIDDLEACRAAIEATRPAWQPPQHGYHPHTFGPMVDILMTELTGQRVSDFWEERVRRPLALPFYIGHLPADAEPQVAALEYARRRAPLPATPFFRAFFDAQSPVHRAFHSILGPDSPQEMSQPAAWQIGCPAKGGVASARGLAQFYQALAGLLPQSPFPTEVYDHLRTQQCSGFDLTLQEETAFTNGAMCEPAALFGQGGFGHAGAGGCHAFLEPQSGRSFAFVMNRMAAGALPPAPVRAMVAAMAEL